MNLQAPRTSWQVAGCACVDSLDLLGPAELLLELLKREGCGVDFGLQGMGRRPQKNGRRKTARQGEAATRLLAQRPLLCLAQAGGRRQLPCIKSSNFGRWPPDQPTFSRRSALVSSFFFRSRRRSAISFCSPMLLRNLQHAYGRVRPGCISAAASACRSRRSKWPLATERDHSPPISQACD